MPLTSGALAALRYVAAAPAKKLFSFTLEGEDLKSFARAAELYLQAHAERSFPTLAYYKQF